MTEGASERQSAGPSGEHRFPVRVYYEDTDAGGIVYHANHLKFAERARTEWLRATGLDHQDLRTRFGMIFVVRALKIEYLSIARLDDRLEVTTIITGVGGSRLDMRQSIRQAEGGADVAVLDLTLVAITLDGKVMRMPASLRSALSLPPAPDGED